jgi:rfaE bifunctional protein kinase chain/domain/rfaE bifunctional protein nucleotidyltransferase chain/domain
MENRKKIFKIDILEKILNKVRKNKRIILCHGVFDVLHLGHLEHFKSAKSMGDLLIVTVTEDKYVKKGPKRPFFKIDERVRALQAIEYIDYIAVSNFDTAKEVLKKIKPNIYCKGKDYKKTSKDFTRQILGEIKTLKKYGGKIEYTKDELYSSSKIINNSGSIFDEKQVKFLNNIKSNFNFDKINRVINNFKNLKILIIGEIIIDQYNFCKVIGKSGKEPVVTFQKLKSEKYLGGAGAIANHLSSFSDKVTVFSSVGDSSDQLSFIKKKLNKNIKLNFIKKENSSTILKEKYVQEMDNRKVFSTYTFNDEPLNKLQDDKVKKYIHKNIKKFDLVIVSDYGHGFLSKKTSKQISKLSSFLSVNCQINSANVNSHTLKNYKNYEFLIINETELRHELRNKSDDIKKLVKLISNELKINNVIVTQGSLGATFYSRKINKFYFSPAFSSKVIDKVGAGDAMLAVSAMCLKENLDTNLLLLIGSLAASQVVEAIGNSKTINKTEILKSINYMLK